MGIIGNLVGGYIGVKLVNGKFKPKFGKKAIISLIILVILFFGFVAFLIYGIKIGNFEYIIMPLLGILALGYIFLISPYFQNSNNYYIEFQNEHVLSGFKLMYKGKLVRVNYIVANDGRIAFADNLNKTKCISYFDGTKMSNFTKYRIINYFSKWLSENNLLSDSVTVSYEGM